MRSPLELVHRYYEAGNRASAEIDADDEIRADIGGAVERGDAPAMAAFVGMVDEDAEFTADEHPGEVFRGPAGLIAIFQQWMEVMSGWRVEIAETTEIEDGVVFSVRVRARGRGSGIELDEPGYCLLRFNDEKVVAFHEFETLDDAHAAAGL